MRRILKFLMSRSFFFSVMILLQLALFIALMVTFSRVGGVAYLLITLTVVVVMMAVLEKTNTNPAYRIMWLLIMVTMPMSGALFYLLWGSHGIKPKRRRIFFASSTAPIKSCGRTKLPSAHSAPNIRNTAPIWNIWRATLPRRCMTAQR